MENGSLEVVDMDFVFDDVEAEVVGFAVGARFCATAGHQGGKGLRVVIATSFASEGGIGFDHGRASDLVAPDDEGLVKEAVAFEILDESGGRLCGCSRSSL